MEYLPDNNHIFEPAEPLQETLKEQSTGWFLGGNKYDIPLIEIKSVSVLQSPQNPCL